MKPSSHETSNELRLLLSARQFESNGSRIAECLAVAGKTLVPVLLEDTRPVSDCGAEVAWFTRDVYSDSIVNHWSQHAQRFFDCCKASRQLRFVHLFSSGSDFEVVDDLIGNGVAVSSSIGASGIPLAHTAIAGMMAISRGFPRFIEFKSQRNWITPTTHDYPADLEGQTALVVGLGAVGNEIARLCKALRMRVIALTRDGQRQCRDCDEQASFADLRLVAPRSDWIFLACPSTSETRGMISRKLLDSLRPDCALINIARGALIDESALCDALAERRLRAAYLDVFSQEPLPETSRLWDLQNVIMSPHNAALSKGNEERAKLAFFDNLGAYVRGLTLKHLAVR